jgi:ADP-ribose pyrophosphatase YjhB (NUDIX family)
MPIPSVNRPPEAAPPTVAKPKRYTIPTVKKAPIQAKPQEEKNLVVVHGIKSSKLSTVAENGLAMPSLGIIHKDYPFTGFGDVTLLAHPSHINPKHTPVYNRDAWTPRFNAKVVEEGKLNNDKWTAFKNEVHDATDRHLNKEWKRTHEGQEWADRELVDSPDLDEHHKYRAGVHNQVDRALGHLHNDANEIGPDYGHHNFSYVLPHGVMNELTPGGYLNRFTDDRSKYWNPKIKSLFDTKKYIKDRDGKWQVELTPENEKEILGKIRGKSTIKGGEYGGMNQIIHNDDLETAIDVITARKLGSYADIKREAQKTLQPSEGTVKSTPFPYIEGKKNNYNNTALRKIVLRALKAGKTVEHYLSDRPLLDDKDIPVDDSEKARVAGILDNFVNQKRQDTQRYFEAKPQRFFRLGDFKAAVVPRHHMEAYQDLFAQHGVKMYPYDTNVSFGEKSSRAKAVRLAAEENDLLLSEKDCGLEELKKSELLEELGVELELEELKKSCEGLEKGAMQRLSSYFGNNNAKVAKTPLNRPDYVTQEEKEVIVGPGKFELHQPGLAKSEETIEEPSKCVLTVITDGIGHMLFIKRNDNHKWSVCAGHIEGDEDPEDAARREILEETGLTPEHITRIYESKNPNVTCYSAQCQGTPHGRNDPDNEGEPQWVDVTRGIPIRIWDNLAGPEDETNIVRQLFQKDFRLKKSRYDWLDAGFLDLG